MPTLRKGSSIGPRESAPPDDISSLTTGSAEDARSGARHATRAQLIAAIRWCDGQPTGHKTRREHLAAELRKREMNEALA